MKTIVIVKGRTFPEVFAEYSKDQTVYSKEHLINSSSNTQFTLSGGIGNKRNGQGKKEAPKATVIQPKNFNRYFSFCPGQRSQNTELMSSKMNCPLGQK